MTVHLLGLPHTQTTKHWSPCAFTQKVRTLSAMLLSRGHETVIYSGEDNDAPCTEHVAVVTGADRRRWFGEETYEDRVFDRWDTNGLCWTEFNAAIVEAINLRARPHDVISLTMGLAHKQVADAFPSLLSVELGVGYEGSFADFRVFESYAWMHHTYGRQGINDGRFYDTVIPNAFDPADFHLAPKDDYLLFLGRHTPRKGLAVVEELAKHHRVLTAGQGEARVKGAEYMGVVRGEERAELLARARAVLVPTQYIEPFGGVAVEAQLSGTPAITTDFGAFTETIEQGVTGFRCHTLAEFLLAVEDCEKLEPVAVRTHAVGRYSLPVIADQYDAHLSRLGTLWGDGWYS